MCLCPSKSLRPQFVILAKKNVGDGRVHSFHACLFSQRTNAGREEMDVESKRLKRDLEARCRELEAENQVSSLLNTIWSLCSCRPTARLCPFVARRVDHHYPAPRCYPALHSVLCFAVKSIPVVRVVAFGYPALQADSVLCFSVRPSSGRQGLAFGLCTYAPAWANRTAVGREGHRGPVFVDVLVVLLPST